MLVLKLPGGREVRADDPNPTVQAAARRAAAALLAGRQPQPADARLLRLWLAQQEERHGGVQ